MHAHTRALVAASAYAFLSGRKAAGLYDHTADRHLRIAAESRGNRLQAYDGERAAAFGGTLPELYDQGDEAFVSLALEGATARGYDRATASFYEARVTDRLVELFDHGEGAWFAFTIQNADGESMGEA